jgi:hypothetical protein
LQQDASNTEQPVGDAAQGEAVRMAAGAQGYVAAVTFRVVLHRSAGPVEHRLAQPYLGGTAHHDDAGLATALGHRALLGTSQILFHSPAVAQKHYTRADGLEASRRHANYIDQAEDAAARMLKQR